MTLCRPLLFHSKTRDERKKEPSVEVMKILWFSWKNRNVMRHLTVKGHTKKKLFFWVSSSERPLDREVSVWMEGWKDGKKWRATKSLEANDVIAQMYSRIQGNKTKQAERHDGNSAKCHTNKIYQVSKKQHSSWGRKLKPSKHTNQKPSL